MIYTLKDKTYFATPKDNLKDLLEIEIGDSKDIVKFQPQMKICRWQNECNVSLRLIDTEVGVEKLETVGDKIKYSKGNKECLFYQIKNEEHPEGASEFEIILKKKPKTNKIEFSVVDKDVDYFYQPALTQKEKDEGASRPENVIGSYAIYAKTPKTNWEGGKEYKCGKIGHIFRPQMIDAKGNKVWGSLKIEKGILSVEIPQEFLDEAVYPIRHATGLTFGYTTAGASSYGVNSGIVFGGKFTASEAGTGDSMSVYMKRATGSNSLNAKCSIYDASENLITNGTTAEQAGITTAAWFTMNFATSPSFSSGTNRLAVFGNWASPPSGDPTVGVYYDTGGSVGQAGFDGGNTYPTFPNPFSADSNVDYLVSIYCTYTAAGGTPTDKFFLMFS